MPGRRSAPLLLGVLSLASVLMACQELRGGVVTTTAPDLGLGPAPVAIPANPRQVVTMRPGPAALNSSQTQFVESQPGYIEGTAKVEAIYPGGEGPLHILTWEVNEPRFGAMTCNSISSPELAPSGHGCGSSDAEALPFTVHGYGYSTGEGEQSLMVNHSPDAEATVIELADASTFVIRPGTSSVSYHQWNGPRPVRVTMFWTDGSTTSEELTP
jgi:hypothetical protein